MRLVVLLLMITPFMVHAQEYSRLIRLANSAYSKGQYVVSAQFYDSAYAVSAGENFRHYDAACSYSLAGNLKKAIQFLEVSFQRDEQNFDWMYYDKDLDAIRNLPEYIELEKHYKDPTVLYYFDILQELGEEKAVFYVKKRVSLVQDLLSRYSLEEIRKRTGLSLPFQPGDTVFNFSDRSLEFVNCTFENTDNGVNGLSKLAVKTLHFFNCRGPLELSNLRLDNLIFLGSRDDNNFESLRLFKIKQHGVFKLFAKGNQITIDSSSFTIALPTPGIVPLAQNNYVDMDDKGGLAWGLEFDAVNIYATSFSKDDQENKLAPFDVRVQSKNLKMVNISFDHTLRLRGSASESLNIKWNGFPEFIDFFNLRFPEFECYIPFTQFEQSTFVRLEFHSLGAYSVIGDNAAEYADESLVDMLTSLYKRLYDNYRSRADLISSNHIYVRLKELEIAHLKMKPDKNLEDRMRLWLNQLMGVYTDHATSPGKAILISFYIVLVFGVFYFFFPSEWDKTGKSQLVEDFRIFINKNEHGYVKPFFKMVRGFLLSFLNAVTLSMNAFITLGFGSIPTTGLARYVCVFQGVLGWFLLSLFTVALLNQVLL